MRKLDDVKVTATLPPNMVWVIKALSIRLNLRPSKLLQRAVNVEKFLDNVESEGGKAFIERADGRIERIARHSVC